jgi:putative ABC transport system ATP-binding protein
VALTVAPPAPAKVVATLSGSATPQGADPVYRLTDVIRIYREAEIETIALRGIDLDIPRGSFMSLMGRSGSGKSTLLALLAGADRPSAGRVLYRDVDLGRAPEPALQGIRGREIGLLFQADNLAPFLSVAENMALAAGLAGRPLEPGLARAVLDRVGLDQRAGHRPAQLSGGEQQRAALACVLAAAAPVLLRDEPTAELDSRTAAMVLDLVGQLQGEHHLTVVLATHDPAVARRADRIVTLASGRITDDRSA